jgi:hypothetical protein
MPLPLELDGFLLRGSQLLAMRSQIHSINLTFPRLPGIILRLFPIPP